MHGLRTDIERIDFEEIREQVSSAVFNLEASLFLTFKELLTRPGQMVKEFLAGRRKQYYKPVP